MSEPTPPLTTAPPSVAGYGTTVEYGSALLGATPTYTFVEHVDEVTPPEVTVAATVTKHMKSANQAVTKKASWKDTGAATVRLFYKKADLVALVALTGVARAWRFSFADGGFITFDGFISKWHTPVDIDGDVMVTLEITPVGLPTFTGS